MAEKNNVKTFIIITLLTSLWVHAYQLIRFFAYVRAEVQEFLYMVPDLAPMDDLLTLLIWGLWDTLLSTLYVVAFWLCVQAFGNNRKSIMVSALMSWCFFFVLYWVGNANMNLIGWKSVAAILPMTFLEPLVASAIASRLYAWKQSRN